MTATAQPQRSLATHLAITQELLQEALLRMDQFEGEVYRTLEGETVDAVSTIADARLLFQKDWERISSEAIKLGVLDVNLAPVVSMLDAVNSDEGSVVIRVPSPADGNLSADARLALADEVEGLARRVRDQLHLEALAGDLFESVAELRRTEST